MAVLRHEHTQRDWLSETGGDGDAGHHPNQDPHMASSINMMPVEVIWATVDRAQADTIRDALQVQSIPCEIGVVHVQDGPAYLLWLPNADQAEAARDFIWRKQSGMRLRPDWAFAPDDGNPTFNRWIDI